MKVYNYRKGFATNSSSSHSILVVEDPIKKDRNVDRDEHYGLPGTTGNANFQWDRFLAAEKQTKEEYLAGILYSEIGWQVPEETRNLLIGHYMGKPITNNDIGNIDHQSILTLPSRYDNPEYLDPEFVADFKKFLLSQNVCIVGGNDNCYDEDNIAAFPPNSTPVLGFIPRDERRDYMKWTCRYDSARDYWVLFSRENGTKIRFSFNSPEKQLVGPLRSEFPELVDMKITDYCERNCDFCYQGSTKQGKHADEYAVYRVLEELSRMKVFEVAFGGGEPTSHPQFIRILEQARTDHIVPNFSTGDIDWLKGREPYTDKMAEKVVELCGQFAISVTHMWQLTDAMQVLTERKVPRKKISFQMIPGAAPDFLKMVSVCNEFGIKYTLLGLKQPRRDITRKLLAEYKKKYQTDSKYLLKHLKEYSRYGNLSVDTTFAKDFEEELKKAKIDPNSYSTQEGINSMYIDVVVKQMGPSSFCSGREMLAYSEKYEDEEKTGIETTIKKIMSR